MKKYLIIFFAIMAVIFSSCSNETTSMEEGISSIEVEKDTKQESLASLQGQIASFNDSICVHPSETRGFFSFFNRLWRVVSADAVGGLFGNLWGGPVGAIVGAAACSTYTGADSFCTRAKINNSEKWTLKYELNNNMDNLIPLPADGTSPTLQDSIGYYHNKAILDLSKKDIKLSINKMPILLLDEVKKEMPRKVTFTPKDSIQLNKTYSEFVKNEQNFSGVDIDAYEKHLISCYPSQSGEINVIFEFLKGVSSIKAEDETTYIQTILRLIDSSDLSNTIKQNLRNGVIVGNASNKLWQVKTDVELAN